MDFPFVAQYLQDAVGITGYLEKRKKNIYSNEVLDVYERPYDPEFPVVCLDESPKQLISEVRKGFADSKGVQYFDYEYIINIFSK